MNENPEVTAWLGELEHPLIDTIEAARKVILGADDRVTETIKWKSPTFMFEGNIVSIDPKAKKHVTLLFHRGAEIPGEHPQLDGGGKLARYVRFGNVEDVTAGAGGLADIIRAWCDWKA